MMAAEVGQLLVRTNKLTPAAGASTPFVDIVGHAERIKLHYLRHGFELWGWDLYRVLHRLLLATFLLGLCGLREVRRWQN